MFAQLWSYTLSPCYLPADGVSDSPLVVAGHHDANPLRVVARQLDGGKQLAQQ